MLGGEVSTESGSDRVAADFQDCYPVATALGTDSTTVVLQIKTPLKVGVQLTTLQSLKGH